MTKTERISRVFKNAPVIHINDSSKIVIVSDCHRGTGDYNDNFADNESICFNALMRYFNDGYTYIELGDGDELWENRKFGLITDENNHIFWLLGEFAKAGRLHMILGNHDMVKKNPKWRKKNLSEYYNEREHSNLPLFGDMDVPEGLILEYGGGVHRENPLKLCLLHGHQGDLLCDDWWRLGRFLVRNIWRPMELVGLKDPRSTAENRTKQNQIERRLSALANQRGDLIIAGHTHRPYFPSITKSRDTAEYPRYFNTGSCVHPRCITAIEISRGSISLVKWGIRARTDGVMFIKKSVTGGPLPLANFL
jgi:UDP-2,3-diacylglucosamine pyrophosphatase LpxH